MESFTIAKLDTDVGILRIIGVWDPLTAQIQLIEIAQLSMDGWADVTFWLTEQNFEYEIQSILAATKNYLLSDR